MTIDYILAKSPLVRYLKILFPVPDVNEKKDVSLYYNNFLNWTACGLSGIKMLFS